MSCWVLEVDWPVVADVLAALGGMLAGGATVFLAIAAMLGLSTWKEQMETARRTQLIDDILSHAYEVQEVFRHMASPFSTNDEHARVPRGPNEPDAEWQRRAPYGVAGVRYNDHLEQFSRLRADAFRAKAIFGQEMFDAASAILMECRAHVFHGESAYRAVRNLERLHDRATTQAIGEREFKDAAAAAEKAEIRFWGLGDEPEAPQNRMAALVSRLEAEAAKQPKKMPKQTKPKK